MYILKVIELRRKILIVKVEFEWIKVNKKILKKGKKNRVMFEKECGKVFVVIFVIYMEKKKFDLRKLKWFYYRK